MKNAGHVGRPRDGSHGPPMRFYSPFEHDPERRCEAIARTTGVQCEKWVVKGAKRCRTHGGRRRMTHLGKSIYTKRAKGKFKELISEMEQLSTEDRIDLSAEVDVMRTVASRSVLLFQRACFPEEDETKMSFDTKIAAISLVQNTLKEVGVMVEKCAKVAMLSSTILNPQQVQFIFDQLTAILTRLLKEDHGEILTSILNEMDNIKLISKEQSVNVILG